MPTRRSGSASPSGNSAARERRPAIFNTTQDGVASPQLRFVSLLHPTVRRGGGGRRDHDIYAHGATTMLAFGLLLNIAGIGVFCWLIITLAVYALPFFVAINAGIWAFHSGAGLLGTPLVAVAAGGITLAIARIAFAVTNLRSCAPSLRPCSLCRPHLLAIMSVLRWPKSGCLRLRGRNLRLPRCGLHRWHSMDASDHLHAARRTRTGQGGQRRSSPSFHSRHTRGMISSPSSSNRFA